MAFVIYRCKTGDFFNKCFNTLNQNVLTNLQNFAKF